LSFAGAASAAPNPTLVCEQSKLVAQAGLEVCLKLNSANMLKGAPDGSASCWANFNATLKKIDAAAAKAGTACRYVDNGNGTVSDLNTGLVWEKKSAAGTGDVHDVDNLYSWSISGIAPDGQAFTVFLATLNNGVSTDGGATTAITGCFANHCDWRLPSIVELQGIVETSATGCTSGSPCIDPTFGPTQSNLYWSATTNAVNAYGAWGVYFFNGSVLGGLKAGGLYVRAVRSGL
jgi:hypothetical protein